MVERSSIEDFWSVIPAGGAGTRLWPLSRAGSPKFLHDLTSRGRSLLQATADRLSPLCDGRLVVVTGVAHRDAVLEQLPQLGADDVLAEPAPRDSMAAIGLAAAVIERRDPEAIIGSFAADHVVGREEEFRQCVREAVEVARTDRLVTIGIRPTFPSTGFGYIRCGDPVGLDLAPRARDVASFVEKPDEKTAQQYLDNGGYRWNAGMFVVKARVLLDLLQRYQPELAAELRAIAAEPETLERRWDGLKKIAIDHAVAEPASVDGQVAVVLADFPWDDVGDFDSLAGLLPADPGAGEVKVLGDTSSVYVTESSGVVVSSSDRFVAVLGMDDVVVVDTPDALLVTTRGRAQQVKSVVESLKSDGRGDLT